MTQHTPSVLGMLVAALLYAVSVSPSLLPRRWWWQGFVSGLLMAWGYAQGWLLQNVGYNLANEMGLYVRVRPIVSQVLPWVALAIFMVWVIFQVVHSYRSAIRAAAMVNMRPVRGGEYLLGLVATLAVFNLAVLVLRFTVWVFVSVVHGLGHYVADPVALAIAVVVWVLLILFLYNRVILRGTLAFFAREAAKRNDRNSDLSLQPKTALRSGSEQSLCSWQSVGAQGRAFLSRGPNCDEIAKALDRDDAEEPIRVYVGYQTEQSDFAAQAQLAVAEAQRAGAFDRPYILVYTATGSGWVDEWLVEPFEYLTAGNCATITMQYSYLFSAAVLITDMKSCRDASHELFWAIRRHVDSLPEESRPHIFVAGESLGADGATAPFSTLEEMLTNTEGALLVGTPSSSKMHRELTRGRLPGSPEVAPVYDSGRQVRFVNTPEQLDADIYGRPFTKWQFPRVVFAQHASDPVVWYSAATMFQEPDWIRERAGLDVSPDIRFTWLATYLQILCDMPMAGTAPGGHGHTYTDELIPAWLKILGIEEPAFEMATAESSLTRQIGADIWYRMKNNR